MMLTTRPLLLHVIRPHQRAGAVDTTIASSQIPEVVLALVKACVRSARQSYTILIEEWISGSFKPFDYTRTQYLFSAGTILAISNFLGFSDSPSDQEDFDLACKFMENMVQAGSLVAAEFYQHLEAIKTDICTCASENGTWESGTVKRHADAENANAQSSTAFPEPCTSAEAMAADFGLNEPSLDSFLLQDQLSGEDQSYLDASLSEDLYWPVFDIS